MTDAMRKAVQTLIDDLPRCFCGELAIFRNRGKYDTYDMCADHDKRHGPISDYIKYATAALELQRLLRESE